MMPKLVYCGVPRGFQRIRFTGVSFPAGFRGWRFQFIKVLLKKTIDMLPVHVLPNEFKFFYDFAINRTFYLFLNVAVDFDILWQGRWITDLNKRLKTSTRFRNIGQSRAVRDLEMYRALRGYDGLQGACKWSRRSYAGPLDCIRKMWASQQVVWVYFGIQLTMLCGETSLPVNVILKMPCYFCSLHDWDVNATLGGAANSLSHGTQNMSQPTRTSWFPSELSHRFNTFNIVYSKRLQPLEVPLLWNLSRL